MEVLLASQARTTVISEFRTSFVGVFTSEFQSILARNLSLTGSEINPRYALAWDFPVNNRATGEQSRI